MNMDRVVKYDVLRVIASFSIVLLHVSASYWSVVDVYGGEFVVMTVYNSLTRFAVPVFFMLSGVFLLSPRKENPAVGRRVLKLVLLFYVWSAFYAFQGAAMDALRGEFSPQVWRAAGERFIFGHVHMWFLQILCGFYLLIPIARQLCRDKKALRYYLSLWVVFRFLLPCLTELFGLETLQARIDSLGMDILVGNFGYFLAGYYLSVADIPRAIRRGVYGLGILALCATPLLTLWICRRTGAWEERWFSPSSPNVLLMSAAIFLFFRYSTVPENGKRAVLWGKLSGYTFFIYLFHMFVIEKLNLAGITTVSFPAVISIPVLTTVTFLVSLLGAFVVDHIPVVRKAVMLH